ncbi:putative DNA binding domain-containing protein [Mollicutes bacterium LVI A0039]|nr:putative DNA binding domain-containing protein [Mollicutes bacterium LVI A0039]
MENHNTEYKREYSRNLHDTYVKTVIAFLNTDGGCLEIGIKDDGTIVGIDESKIDEITRTLQDIFFTRICEYNYEEIRVEKKLISDKMILHVTVKNGASRPYYDTKKGMVPEGVFYRENGMTKSMPKDKIQSLYSKIYKKDISSIKASHQLFEITLLEHQLKKEDVKLTPIALMNLGLLDNDGNKTLIYELCADENSTSIKFNKYLSSTKSDLIESNQFGEIPLYETARLLLEKIKVLNDKEIIITSGKRVERSKVDDISVREIILNAIVHNDYTIGYPQVDWYNDRLEVTSHGGLPQGMTKDEFYAGKSVARNAKLVKIFDKLKFVESIGSGIDRVQECYDINIFDITDNYFKVTLKFNSHKNRGEIESSTSIKEQVIFVITHSNGISVNDIAEQLQLSPKTIYRYISELLDEDIITRTKQGKVNLHFKK